MADRRVDNTDGIMARTPKRAEMFGILTGDTTTEQGKPLEAPNNLCYISQTSSVDNEHMVIQNEATVSAMNDGIAHMANQNEATTIMVNAGFAQDQQYGNEASNEEVKSTLGNLGFYQQQFAINQQLLLQQQQTVNTLINKVDSLSKLVEKRNKKQSAVRESNTPPANIRKRKYHVLSDSDIEDVSSESQGEDNSDSECPSENSGHAAKISRLVDIQKSSSAHNNEVLVSGCSNMKLLQEMGNEFEKLEAVGPKVNDILSKVVNSGIRAQIDRNVAKELVAKYDRPENCEALKVPRVNKELWNTSTFAKQTKEMDKAFQTTQKYLNQGLVPLVVLMNKMLSTENTEDFRLARDSFQLLAYAHRDMSNLRRQLIKSVVADKYKQLCNDSTPITENLLGDELEKQVKTVDEMRKVGHNISKYKTDRVKNKSYQGYDRKGSSYKKGSSFRNSSQQSFLYKKHRRQQSSGLHKNQNKKKDQQ